MKIKIIIIGPKVHDVGYRPFLIALADGCDIERFGVKNDVIGGEQAVIARLEADNEQITEFMEAVKTKKPQKAQVTDIKREPYDGRVPSIERTAITNMNAQLAKGIQRLDELPAIKANTDILPDIKRNTDILPDIKKNTDILPDIKANTYAIKVNTDAIPHILEEIRGMKEELQPGFSIQIQQMQKDIESIKERLGMP
ncbi:MAG: acylphosphatase [Methanotrichaceae archaeon]